MDVDDHPARLRVAGDLLEPFPRHRPDTVRREPDAALPGQRLDPRQVRRHVRIAEAGLALGRWLAGTGAGVGTHQQHDLDAGIAGGRHGGLGHRVGVVVGGTSGMVVWVVELAHRRVAGRHHLVVEQQRDLVGAVGIDRVGGAVHLVPPCPEVVAGMGRIDVLDAPPQHALEGVAVGVDEPRQAKRGLGHVRILPD